MENSNSNPAQQDQTADFDVSAAQAPAEVASPSQEQEKQQILKEAKEGERYGKDIEFWLSCMGYCIGFGNVWRFPYVLYKNGGAAFLIPYFLAIIGFAVPLYYLENTFGQLVRCKLVHRFSMIHPKLWGVQVTQFLLGIFVLYYYTNLLCWTISFIGASFQSPLPWTSADQLSEKAANLEEGQTIWDNKYFVKDMLQQNADPSDGGSLVGRMVFCSFLGFVVVYLAIFRGLKSVTKVAYFTVPAPYIFLFILLIKAATLEGSGTGMKYLLKPDWSKLGEATIWIDAVT